MAESRKYMEMIGVFEVEVVDPDTARSYVVDWGKDPDGNPVVMSEESDEKAVEWAVDMFLTNMMAQRAEQEAGFKFLGGGFRARPVLDQKYMPETIPGGSIRNDDGRLEDE